MVQKLGWNSTRIIILYFWKQCTQWWLPQSYQLQNYLKWLKESLLPNLDKLSSIILDFAKYRNTKPKCTPKVSKMKRSEIVQESQRLRILFSIQENVNEVKKSDGLDKSKY